MNMTQEFKQKIAVGLEEFRLPRYDEIPNVGLYLEQTVMYISNYLAQLPDSQLTTSMVSNYVKKKLIESPVKKRYYRDHIAYLIFIAITKPVLTIENIRKLFVVQEQTYDRRTAYNYFCSEFENILACALGLKAKPDDVGQKTPEHPDVKMMLRSAIITAANKIYLERCFDYISKLYEQPQ